MKPGKTTMALLWFQVQNMRIMVVKALFITNTDCTNRHGFFDSVNIENDEINENK